MKTPSYAERAILLLEDQMRARPPHGVSDERLVRFFAEHRQVLVRQIELLIAREIGTHGLMLVLRADPNPDFPPGSYNATVQIPAQWVRVASLREAQQRAMAFRDAHALGGGNWTGGEVFRDGQPYARISYNGRIWDALLGGELDVQGRPVPSPDAPRPEPTPPQPAPPRRRRR